MPLLIVGGLPGSGKTHLLDEYLMYRKLDCIYPDAINKGIDMHYLNHYSMCRDRIGVDGWIFCKRSFRKEVVQNCRGKIDWLFFEPNIRACVCNIIYDYCHYKMDLKSSIRRMDCVLNHAHEYDKSRSKTIPVICKVIDRNMIENYIENSKFRYKDTQKIWQLVKDIV